MIFWACSWTNLFKMSLTLRKIFARFFEGDSDELWLLEVKLLVKKLKLQFLMYLSSKLIFWARSWTNLFKRNLTLRKIFLKKMQIRYSFWKLSFWWKSWNSQLLMYLGSKMIFWARSWTILFEINLTLRWNFFQNFWKGFRWVTASGSWASGEKAKIDSFWCILTRNRHFELGFWSYNL